MTEQISVREVLRHDAEAFIRSATPEKLISLLGNNGDWGDPSVELLIDLVRVEDLQLSSMFLEAIWIKTNDPRRVLEALLQPGGAESFDFNRDYCEMFNKMPWLEKMWADVSPKKQVQLTQFVIERGSHSDSDNEFDVTEAFYLAISMVERMRPKEGTDTYVYWEILNMSFDALLPDDEHMKILRSGLELFGKLITTDVAAK